MALAEVQTVKDELHKLASQVYVLGTTLQTVAPPGSPGQSITYLLEVAKLLEKASHDAAVLLTSLTSPSPSFKPNPSSDKGS